MAAVFALAVVGFEAGAATGSVNAGGGGNPYGAWRNGPSSDASYFPIAVWLQAPRNASRYKEAGINVYVGLWKGPTEEQLAELKKADMKVVCHQNEVGLKHVNDATIIGWMHGDEPDNAQSLGEGKGYGPPIAPAKIVEDYLVIRKADPSRPVLLNLGQGVAWDNWHGRGVRTNKPEDYPEYIKGCDVVSFDIYPVVHSSPEVQGRLWYVPQGVERLRKWSADRKVVWNCIECTRISSERKAAPQQVKAEVWMSLIHGSMGIIYFVHEWKPRFNEHALLDDAEMLREVTQVNGQIHALAPVLNSPSVPDAVKVVSSKAEVPVDAMVKKPKGGRFVYIFAVCMRDSETEAAFVLRGLSGYRRVEVLGEERALRVAGGRFSDKFGPWEVHLYRLSR